MAEPGGEILTIADAVRTIRERRGWSQRQLGAAIGVTRQTVSRYESAAIGLSADRVQAIATALHVEPGLLYRVRRGDPCLHRLHPFAP
jgi:transcriptional regulator with XRE-family HTH domain